MPRLSKPPLGSHRRSDKSRAAILEAAVVEFANEGVSGARTDAIARAAKVNKALLYYYFKDKEALYGAVLDQVFGGLSESVHKELSRKSLPAERILAYAGAHFDYIAHHPLYPRIVQSELMSAGRGRTEQFERIVKQYFRPLFLHLHGTIMEGISREDFRRVDPMQFVPSMIAVITFYFTAAPVMQNMTGTNPMSRNALAVRRAAVLDFISAALFVKSTTGECGQKKLSKNARSVSERTK
jgi:TetR/AcrR family transcriptional regulator